MWGKPKSALHREDQDQHSFLCLTSFLLSLRTPSLRPPQKNYKDKMASNVPAEGVVTLKMINELQQQVLDNNPIYKYLLSDVSFPLPPSPLYYLDPRSPPTHAPLSSKPPSLVPFLGPLTANNHPRRPRPHRSTSSSLKNSHEQQIHPPWLHFGNHYRLDRRHRHCFHFA